MQCDWPIDASCLDGSWAEYERSTREYAVSLASATLARLTGGRVGGCQITVRPCAYTQAAACFGPGMHFATTYGNVGYYPMNWRGTWLNICPQPYCGTHCEVRLPPPVGALGDVKVNGTLLNPADLRVDNGYILVWQGTGDCPWNFEQNLSLPDTEAGTFSVTYLNAYPVDALGQRAVAILAQEYAKACCGQSCELPSTVTTIARQGLTLEVASGSFPGGETGLREVDAYIALWNPRHLRQSPTVWSPDLPENRVQTL